ncbi:hypothetical protein [Marinactinospora rubrisoli]|uniref:hypothetical protein n=1 Tax=Marinactinospora rubrisoli TaxID=2715399 RepID=UPI0036D26E3E
MAAYDDGRLRWRRDGRRLMAGPVGDGPALLRDYRPEGRLEAVRVADGEPVWTGPEDLLHGDWAITPSHLLVGPTVKEDRDLSDVVAVDLGDGSRHSLDLRPQALFAISGPVVMRDGYIRAAPWPGVTVVFDGP